MNLLAPNMVWGLSAACIAVVCETIYKHIPGQWAQHLWAVGPLQTAMSYCIYRLVTVPDTTLIDAFVVFAFCTISMRISSSLLIFNEHIRTGTWIALALIVLAKFAQAKWGR